MATGNRTRGPVVQAVDDTASRGEAFTLRQVMERARRQGHPRLPTFVAVHLLQKLSAAMEAASTLPEGRLTIDTVSLFFDGTFAVAGSSGAAEDTLALASLFEPLGGIPPDDLSPVLATALRGELTSPRVFAQRLAHWAVKQRQPPSGMDLGAALLAWLFPEEAETPPPLAQAEYFAEERTAQPAAPVRVKRKVEAPTAERTRSPFKARTLVIAAVVSFVAVFVLLKVAQQRDEAEFAEPPKLVIAQPSPREAPRPKSKAVQPVADTAFTETLPHFGHGVPITFKLSQLEHGVDLTRAGKSVMAPGPVWSARTMMLRDAKTIPPYAWLYAAQFDENGGLSGVTAVGPRWTKLTGVTGRFFVLQPDHQPDEGSFDLALGTGATNKPGERFPKVFGEAVTQQEGVRYILDELSPGESYLVTVQKPATGPAPIVVMSGTQPRAWMYTGRAIHENGPLLQTVLTPGVPFKVKSVTRLSFVVLGTPGSHPGEFSVTVQSTRDLAKASNAEAMAHYKKGEEALLRDDYVTAINELTKCKLLDPKAVMCSDLLAQSRRLFELGLK